MSGIFCLAVAGRTPLRADDLDDHWKVFRNGDVYLALDYRPCVCATIGCNLLGWYNALRRHPYEEAQGLCRLANGKQSRSSLWLQT